MTIRSVRHAALTGSKEWRNPNCRGRIHMINGALKPTPSDVVACLHRHGFHTISSVRAGAIELRHPTADGLFVSCGDYLDAIWMNLSDEFQELQQAIGGLRQQPTSA